MDKDNIAKIGIADEINCSKVNLTLSTYDDPLYGQTTRLNVNNNVETEGVLFENVNTLGQKIHAANLPAVSNDIKTKLSGIDTKFVEGFNNPAHANNCVKATGYRQPSDIENIICQLRQQYDAAVDDTKKEELFNFITYLNDQKTANNTNWRFETYRDNDGNRVGEVEKYYKKLLGTFVEPTTSYNKGTITIIENLLVVVKSKFPPDKIRDNEHVIDQIQGITRAHEQIKYEADNKNDTYFNAYIYNLNELLKLFKDVMYFTPSNSLNMYKTSKPMSEPEIFNFIIKKNVLKAASSNLGTGIYNMFSKTGNSSQSVVNATPAPAVNAPPAPLVNAPPGPPVNAPPAPVNLDQAKEELIKLVNIKQTGTDNTKYIELKEALIGAINTAATADSFEIIKTNINNIFDNKDKAYIYNDTERSIKNKGNYVITDNKNDGTPDANIVKFIDYIKKPPPPEPKQGFFSNFFSRGGKSKKNKKSHSKKQKKSSRKQQKKRKSSKK